MNINNVINGLTGATNDIAPAYGYGSQAYHTLRRAMFVGDSSTTPTVGTASWTWATNGSGNVPIMRCSGVSYLIPGAGAGTQQTYLTATVSATNCWNNGYRWNDNPLTDDVSSPYGETPAALLAAGGKAATQPLTER